MKCLAFLTSYATAVLAIRPVVNLGYTKYSGQDPGTGTTEFLGLAFAAPPLDDLRWRAPRPPLKNNTVQDASSVRYSRSRTSDTMLMMMRSCSISRCVLGPVASLVQQVYLKIACMRMCLHPPMLQQAPSYQSLFGFKVWIFNQSYHF